MVTIKLNNIEDGVANYTCYPEGKESDAFALSINPVTREIVYNSLFRKNAYVAHAFWKVLEIYDMCGKIPTEAVSVWY